MKTLILYTSTYKNNTGKIAQLFAEKISCNLVNIKDFKDDKVEEYDLIGFGSGVYKEDLSSKIYKLAQKLDVKGKKVFVFSTSGVGMKFYNNGLIKLLESKGGVNIGSFACKGNFNPREFTDKRIFDLLGKLSQGHPNERDLKKAEGFILSILD